MHRGDDHFHDAGPEHGHGHDHRHSDAPAQPARGDNRLPPDLHSHLKGALDERRDTLQALADAFIDGFRKADDKASYLRLAEVPTALPGPDGLEQRLVDVAISTGYQVATASPGFGSRELVYLPFPGKMVRERTTLAFVYVSLTHRQDVDLVAFLAARFADGTG